MKAANYVLLCAALSALCVSAKHNMTTATYKAPLKGPGLSDEASIRIFTPDGGSKFPVFMWIKGTLAGQETIPIFDIFLKYMASKGYIAGAPEYQNKDMCFDMCSDSNCPSSADGFNSLGLPKPPGDFWKIGQPEKARSLRRALDVLCAQPTADCSLGVAVAGHSQGATLAVMLAQIDERVTAVSPWSYGAWNEVINPYGGPTALDHKREEWTNCVQASVENHAISKHKRRLLIGAEDGIFNHERTPHFSGYHCSANNCLQSDGSGHYIIAASEYTAGDKAAMTASQFDNVAKHDFFQIEPPNNGDVALVPSFATGSKPWHMKPTFDWLAEAALVGAEAKVDQMSAPMAGSVSNAAVPVLAVVAVLISAALVVGMPRVRLAAARVPLLTPAAPNPHAEDGSNHL